MWRASFLLGIAVAVQGCGGTYKHQVEVSGLDKPSENITKASERFDPLRQESIRKDQQRIAELEKEVQRLKSQGPATTPPAVQPVLTAAEFSSHTNDDNKDHDTGVFVYVTTADGQTTIAQIENADNSPNDSTEYNDHSDHRLDLIVKAPGISKSACGSFNVRIRQTTHGHDTWKLNAAVTLRFSDGTTLQKSKDGIVLVNNDARDNF